MNKRSRLTKWVTGHGLGDNPTDGEAVMIQGHHGLQDRFPRTDDRHGSMDTESVADFPVYWRTNLGSWSQIGTSSGPPGIATNRLGDGWDWTLAAWQGVNDDTYNSFIHLKAIRSDGFNAFECVDTNDWTYDGVTVAQDGDKFAVAVRADNDAATILAIRGIVPNISGSCGMGLSAHQTVPLASRRRPTLAWDPGISRLLLVAIDKDSGKLYLTSSAPGSSSWTTPTQISGEWTDAPVGLNCSYWYPTNNVQCFMAFPNGDGPHQCRVLQGTVSVSGNTATFNKGGWWNIGGCSFGNVAPAIRIESEDNLRIFYSGTDNLRNLYETTGACDSAGCTWSNYSVSGRSPFGTGIDANHEIHTGYPAE